MSRGVRDHGRVRILLVQDDCIGPLPGNVLHELIFEGVFLPYLSQALLQLFVTMVIKPLFLPLLFPGAQVSLHLFGLLPVQRQAVH